MKEVLAVVSLLIFAGMGVRPDLDESHQSSRSIWTASEFLLGWVIWR